MRITKTLITKKNNTITVDLYKTNDAEYKPGIIFVHGFKGFKNWGFFPYSAEYFAEKGYKVLTFNFSHNGIGKSEDKFTELDKFADSSFSLDLEELHLMINAMKSGYFGESKNEKIFLVGHSRGGALSILSAWKNNFVTAVAVWASISKLDRFSRRQKDEWKKNGYIEFENARTKQIMRLNYGYLEDIEENKKGTLNIKQAISELNRPLLICHGEQDAAVPIAEAELLYKWSDKEKTKLIKIETTGHTFGVEHPFDSTNTKLEFLLKETYNFFDSIR